MSFPAPDIGLVTTLDLNALLVKRPAATFFMRVAGDRMAGDCIHDGDLLVVDRSLPPVAGKLVVAALAGELVVRRIHRVEGQWHLLQPGSANLEAAQDFELWGMVTAIIHTV
ncbi:hypothetical protein BST81_02265 [Leptolyngbya sp. 'hensonii']|uniref:LexA family protein n=1 Tax=Leptolyngbya sp. 'hensonii' TaxID=1922337 RepID=UPI00094F6F61|nr:S24 family peptidase [Leptolyngbya sp. 'hensonii']OLP20083.1 hypothetical protein BST81_02265 [Leptolyngbya sp. 'hensonii']